MRSLFATLRQLVLPGGAGSGAGRIVLGPYVPTELSTAYAGLGTIVAAILSYDPTGRYHYDAALVLTGTDLIYQAHGFVDPGVNVYETMLEQFTSPQTTTFTGRLTMGAGDSFELASAAFLIDGISAPRGLLGANVATGAGVDLVTSGNAPAAGETAVASAGWNEAEPTYSFADGRIFGVHVYGLVRCSAGAANARSHLKVRQGAASTSGTVLGGWKVFNGGDLSGATHHLWTMFVNTSGATVTDELSLTIANDAGVTAGNNSRIFVGTGTDAVYLAVYDLGAEADYPDLAGALPSVS